MNANLPPILWLDQADACPATQAGNKAANLSALMTRGFAVPPGFVVSAAAFTEGVSPGQVLPPGLETAILEAYRRLLRDTPGAVAVRSSSTSEDLPGRSFAGQYESFLDVRTEPDLIRSVKACQASLHSPRALAYRGGSALSGAAEAMAILVQRMAPAEIAGVLFTANPVTGNHGELLINAAPGQGEALVSGRVTPDQYAVDRESGVVSATLVGGSPVLEAARIQELVQLAKDIEALFGAPQDIEWCWGAGGFSILQSRPVTTLEPGNPHHVVWGHPTIEELSRGQVVFWSNWNTRENMPYALKPLAWSYFSDLLVPEVMAAMWGIDERSPLYPYIFGIDLVNGRAYWNMNLVLGHPFLGPILKKGLRLIDHEADEAFAHLSATGEFKPFKLPVRGIAMVKPAVRCLWTFLRFPWFASQECLQRRCDTFSEQAARFERTPLQGKGVLELLAEVKSFGRTGARLAFPLLMVSGKSLLGSTVISHMTRKWTDLPLGDLARGLEGDKTVETALELFRLSRVQESVRSIYLEGDVADVERRLQESPEGRGFLAELRRWLDCYGHRGTKDLDLGQPSWKEDPGFIHLMLKAYMQLGPQDPDPLQQFQDSIRKREALRREIETRLGAGFIARLFPLRRWLFRHMFRLVHDFFPWRENEKFHGAKMFPGSRRIMFEIGRRYTERGWLDHRDDIFFLSVPELVAQEGKSPHAPGEIRKRVSERKARWLRQIDRSAPFILRSDGRPYETHDAPSTGDCLRGLAASAGRITGIARIIREPSQSDRFGKGEILVAPTTEPGWAPLFLLARGLVMEVGGPICHGAIVAREYGIPAVVGVRGATRLIQDGDRITVDGFTGEVHIHR